MKYCIINATDRAKDNIENIKSKLFNFDFIDDIKYYTVKDNYAGFLLQNGIKLDADYINQPIRGYLAYWATIVSIWTYIIENNIDSILVFEDDAVLNDTFLDIYNKSITDLPIDFDFLSLHTLKVDDLVHNVVDNASEIGSNYIHKANNVIAGAQAMVYSKNGAKKYIKMLQSEGIKLNSDRDIYNRVRDNKLNGYIIRPEIPEILSHGIFPSALDPENTRNVIF
jgi:GR25 family glycosyltransferase involved in LPS biosynthesis